MSRTLEIFIACVLGAGIGTMVSREVNQYFWWLGLLAGGLIGYISCEFKEVLAAVRPAWHRVISCRSDGESIMRKFWAALSQMSMTFFASTFGFLAAVGVYHLIPGSPKLRSVLALLGFFLFFVVSYWPALDKYNSTKGTTAAKMRGTLFYTNPVAMLIYWPFWALIKTLGVIIKSIKLVIPCATKRGIGRPLITFVKTVFILIRSKFLLLCEFDAAIGAAVGYFVLREHFVHSTIVGMMAGGIIGVLDYKIISERILHLVPSKGA